MTPKKKADKPIGEWNRFIIKMQGDRLTVDPAGAAAFGRGDIGLYCYGGEHLVAHRCLDPLGSSSVLGLRFRGDAVIGPAEDISPDQILGKRRLGIRMQGSFTHGKITSVAEN